MRSGAGEDRTLRARREKGKIVLDFMLTVCTGVGMQCIQSAADVVLSTGVTVNKYSTSAPDSCSLPCRSSRYLGI